MGTHTHPTPLHTHVQPHRFAWTEKLFTLLSSTAWLDFYWWTHWHTGSYNVHALWSLVSCGPYSNCWHHTHIHGEWRVPWPRKIIKIEFNETSQAEVMSSGHSQTRLFTPSGSILTPNPFIFPCLLLTKPSPPAPHFTTSDSSSRHSLVWPQRLCSPAFLPESHTPRQQALEHIEPLPLTHGDGCHTRPMGWSLSGRSWGQGSFSMGMLLVFPHLPLFLEISL